MERWHRDLIVYLRNFVDKSQSDWDSWIPYALFTYNSIPHSATNFSPYELLYGRKLQMPSSFSKPPELCYNYDYYVNELKARMQHCHEIAYKNIIENKNKSKNYYDQTSKSIKFHIGNKVLLKNEAFEKGKCKKLLPLWSGPYEIIKVNSDTNYTILYKNKPVVVHVNRLKLFVE